MNECREQERPSSPGKSLPIGYPRPSGHPEIIRTQSDVLSRRAAAEKANAAAAVDAFDELYHLKIMQQQNSLVFLWARLER